MEEHLRCVARLLDGEPMAVCRKFVISRKTGCKIFSRYKDRGLEALTDRCRRPWRYVNQLPEPIEGLIVRMKRHVVRAGGGHDRKEGCNVTSSRTRREDIG